MRSITSLILLLLLHLSPCLTYSLSSNETLIILNVYAPDSHTLNNQSITSLHEGSGTNYLFLTNSSKYTPKQLIYNGTTLLNKYDQLTQFFNILYDFGGFVSLDTSEEPQSVSFSQDGYLEVDGSQDGFYACLNTGDMYGYSRTVYELMYSSGDAPSDSCTAIKLTRENPNSSSDGGNSSTNSATKSIGNSARTSGSGGGLIVGSNNHTLVNSQKSIGVSGYTFSDTFDTSAATSDNGSSSNSGVVISYGPSHSSSTSSDGAGARARAAENVGGLKRVGVLVVLLNLFI